MKKVYLLLLLTCLSLSGFAQITASSYSFSASNTTSYSSIVGSGTSTSSISGDDATQRSISIGFSFVFCGDTFRTVSICTNGWLSLANTSSVTYSNSTTNIPDSAFLMAFWDDLYFSLSPRQYAYYTTVGSAGSRKFIVEWNNTGSTSGSGNGNFQIILYETSNVIEYVYGTSTYASHSATIGIANSTTDYQTLSDASASPTASGSTFTTSIDTAPVANQVYRWTPPPPCGGTPTAGTATADVGSACPSSTFNLSLIGYVSATGLTYQWQSSSDSATWTDISGATTLTYAASESASTYFRAIVTCTASSASDSSAGVLVPYMTFCYCTPAYYYTSPSSSYGFRNFSVVGHAGSTINDNGSGTSSGYEDRTRISVTMQQGGSYPDTIRYVSFSYYDNNQIWIDFDDDGTFATTEIVTPVFRSGICYTSASFDYSVISIPLAARTGTHRLRIRNALTYSCTSSTEMDPCNNNDATNSYYYGLTRDYTVIILPIPACTGTPSAGTVSSSDTAACPSTPFTLTATGYTLASSLSFQWQSSPDGTTWTDISGATGTTYSTTESATTYYHVVVTCTASGISATSTSVTVTYLPICYCTPHFSSSYSCVYGYAITSFTVTGESSTSIADYSSCDGSGYLNQTASDSVTFMQAHAYSANISWSSSYTSFETQTWIDFNDDGTFAASETVGGFSTLSSSPTYNINVPITGTLGRHRMRVATTYSYFGYTYPTLDPCSPGYYGEARDYTVNIIALPACSGTPSAGTAAADVTTACPSLSFNLSVSGFSAAGSLSYQWQSSADSTTWSDISGATTLTYATTETAASYYRMVITCTASGISSSSVPVLVRYSSVCYCTPSYSSSRGCTYGYSFNSFTLYGEGSTSINDTRSCDGTNYLDGTSYSVDLKQSYTYSANVYFGSTSEAQVWIDFNNNGTFESTESVGGGSYLYYSSFNIVIPITAATGTHRMRVAMTASYYGYTYPSLDPCSPGYYGETRDYTVNIVALPACTGTPSAGTASADAATACPGLTVNLAVSGFTVAGSLNFQWQQSADSATWSNISGATAYGYSTTLTDTAFFRCIVTCSATSTSDTSNAVRVNYIGVCYCLPSFGYAATSCTSTVYNFAIGSVYSAGESGTVLNDYASCTGTGYQDRTGLSVSYLQGTTYVATITSRSGGSSYSLSNQVWIDFNNDGTFDASESVGGSAPISASTVVFNENIAIPLTASTGIHRMRVVLVYSGTGISYPTLNSCPDGFYPYYYGEVRDYSVNIVALPACTGTPSPGTAATDIGTSCSGQTITLSVSGFTAAGSIGFQWQTSPDSSTWTSVSGATDISFATTQSAATYYRVVVTCTASGSSAPSNGVKVDYFATCYCTPAFYYALSACTNPRYNFTIGKVQSVGEAGSYLNDTVACTGTGYQDRTVLSVNYMQGVTYVATITSRAGTSTTYTVSNQVWIDFNDDGNFDASESVGGNAGVTGSPAIAVENISLPISAPTGRHRMRIVHLYTGSGAYYPSIDPCPSGYYPYYYGEARDYIANVVALPACTGTPVAGAIVSDIGTACPSSVYNLRDTGYTIASSLVFQWQVSSDSATWSDITGATLITYSGTESSTNFYRMHLTCSASGSSSYTAGLKMNYIPVCYCTPYYVTYYSTRSCSLYGMAMSKFAVNGDSGSTLRDLTPCDGTGYEEHTRMSVNLMQGTTYTATLVSSPTTSSYGKTAQVWIDFDDDASFATSESVGGILSYVDSGVFNVSLPLTAATGSHRMRVQCYYGSSFAYPSLDPCIYGYYYGETRDYTVNVAPLPACTGTPSAGITHSSVTTACPSLPVYLFLNGYSIVGSLAFQWQSSADSSTWISIAGATDITYTTTTSAVAYFRCMITCTVSGSSATSIPVRVDYIPVCYCVPTWVSSTYACTSTSSNYTIHIVNSAGESGTALNDTADCDGSGYLDRTTTSVNYMQSLTYLVRVTSKTGSGSSSLNNQIWIDFNDDATFDASEIVGGLNGYSGTTAVGNTYITLPLTATTGRHRMRIVQTYGGFGISYPSIDACPSGSYPYYYGEARDYTINVVALPPCSGRPTAGAASASTAYACPSYSFTVVDTGYSIASGLAFQWQSSSDSSTWTNISGATASTYTTSTTGATYYRTTVTCAVSGLSDTSRPIHVNYSSACYCFPSLYSAGASCTSYHMTVSALNLVGVTGAISDSLVCNGTGYNDRTALSTTLYQANSYNVTVACGTSYSMYTQFWIDFNDNGIFETTESVGGNSSAFYSGVVSISIPAGATAGAHRLRIVVDYTGDGHSYPYMDPCMSSYYYGEARDYTVNIQPMPPCSSTPSGGAANATIGTACPSLSFSVYATGYTVATGLAYQWQSSSDGSSWSDISGATDLTYATTASAATYYRMKITCTATSASAYSTAVHVAYSSVCYCVPAPSLAAVACSSYHMAISNYYLVGVSGAIRDSAACDGSGYIDRTALSTTLYSGTSYTTTVNNGGTVYSTYCQFWIDFNSDGTFQSSETVGGISTAFVGSATGTLSIPSSVSAGTYRMRVVISYSGSGYTYPSISPCMTGYTYGEARDYTVSIVLPTCVGTPTAGAISASLTTTCAASFSSTLTAAGYSVAPNTVYQWQSSSDSSSWTAIAGATGFSYAATVTGSVYYRFTDSCTASGASSYTAAIRLYPSSVPSAGTITGSGTLAIGATTTLTDAVTGGTWSSTAPTVASITSAGVVSGISIGSATALYVVSNFCGGDTARFALSVIPNCNIITTIAGTGTSSYSGDSGPATAATLSIPYAVAVDASGNVFVAEENNSIIRKISATGTITTVAGTGSAGFSGDLGAATAATLRHPSGVAVDGAGNIYIADRGNNRVRKVNSAGIISTLAGSGTAGYSGDGAPATAAMLNNVFGIVADATGNVFISDAGNARVRKINTFGNISTVAGSGTAGFAGDGAAATSAQLDAPYGLAVDGSGNLFIADFNNHRIRVVNSAGVISTYAGNGTATTSGDGGAATAASLNQVIGIAADGNNNVYLVDISSNVIRKVNSSGVITTIGGTGSASYSGDGGNATAAAIQSPYGVAVDAGGDIYIGDTYNQRIRKITTGNPVVAPITGASSVCVGASVTASEVTTGGTWSSSSTSIATVGSTSGVVTGASAGVVGITYSVSGSCGTTTSSKSVIVNPLPFAGTISGPSVVCESANITLSDTVTGGTWRASNGHATVLAGVVTGVTAGVDTIWFRSINVCGSDSVSAIVTVNPAPNAGAIGGTAIVCEAATISLTETVTGGTWSMTNGNATVDASGVVTGVTFGVDTVRYTFTNSCGTDVASRTVTVNPLPHSGVISGTDTVCTGATVTLSTTGTGGSWSRTNTHASVSSIGVVTGISAGFDSIIYRVTNSCGVSSDTVVMSVFATPTAGTIAGVTQVCEASSARLSESDTTGVWGATNGNATITGGVVTGVYAGLDTITYTVTNLCGSAVARHVMTVNPLPHAGSISILRTAICAGDTTSFVDTVSGGIWSSSDAAIATVDAYGVVHGVSAGTAIITLSVTNLCGTATTAQPIDINLTPVAGTIYGPTSVCVASTILLGDTTGTPGGVWTSSNAGVATVDGSGRVYGNAVGTATITYTYATATCGTVFTTHSVTVNGLPYAGTISGPASVCVGATITLTRSGGTAGGSWSNSPSTVATVSTTSSTFTTVRGLSPGNTTITFTVSTASCGRDTVTTVVTVDPTPVAGTITGRTVVCEESVLALADSGGTAGGRWSSSDTTRLTVSAIGRVTGVLAGTATITYTASTVCGSVYTTRAIAISPLPVPGTISGTATVCPGSHTSLSVTSTGGVWSASNSNAAISFGGVVTGITPGTDTVYYAVSNSCGTRRSMYPVTIAPLPNAGTISGPSQVCLGSSITLNDTMTGGTWAATNTHVTVTGGVVTGRSLGSVIIYYSVVTYCGTATATDSITVLPVLNPAVSVTATPGNSVCTGDYVTLTANPVNGGTAPLYIWYLNNVEVGYGSVFGYIPSNGDRIRVKMFSNAPCRTVDTVRSTTMTMTVNDPVIPTIIISQSADSAAFLGQVVTFTAVVTNGGPSPTYQWFVNGSAVAGATGAVFPYSVRGPSTVFCRLTSNAPCAVPTDVDSDPRGVWADNTGVNTIHASKYSLELYPNPNNGSFTLSGLADRISNEDVKFDVVDMTGKVLFSGVTKPVNGAINQDVVLDQNIVPGQYMLRVINENGAQFIHFTIMK